MPIFIQAQIAETKCQFSVKDKMTRAELKAADPVSLTEENERAKYLNEQGQQLCGLCTTEWWVMFLLNMYVTDLGFYYIYKNPDIFAC